jgi:pyrroline-5-carboxylate reductase
LVVELKVLVVGGGRMGAALVTGLLRSGWATPGQVAVVEPVAERRAELEAAHPGLLARPAVGEDVVRGAAGAVLAVKHDVAPSVLLSLRDARATRILSIVAGLTTPHLEAALPDVTAVVRAMPNSPALIGEGITALCGGSRASSADLDWAEEVMAAVGSVIRLPERHLDAVTGLSGCGPAYVFVVAEAMVEAGVLMGIPREVSNELVIQTLLGSAKLLAEGHDAERLRADVTSPGGATAAGLRALEARAVRSAFLEAVASATERSRQLGH